MAQYLIDHHGFKKLGLEVSAEPNQNGTGSSSTPSAFPETRSTAAGDANPESTTTITAARASPFPGPAPAHLRHAAPTHVFATAQALLDYVTRHWRSRWVTTDVHDEGVLDLLSRRPFFLLISVDAPVTVRWERWRRLRAKKEKKNNGGGAGAGVAASGHGGNGSQMGGYPPPQGMMPPQAPGMRQNRMSTFSMATSVNPFAGPSMNPNPSDEEVFGALRNYLSTQDLMSVTKK